MGHGGVMQVADDWGPPPWHPDFVPPPKAPKHVRLAEPEAAPPSDDPLSRFREAAGAALGGATGWSARRPKIDADLAAELRGRHAAQRARRDASRVPLNPAVQAEAASASSRRAAAAAEAACRRPAPASGARPAASAGAAAVARGLVPAAGAAESRQGAGGSAAGAPEAAARAAPPPEEGAQGEQPVLRNDCLLSEPSPDSSRGLE